MRTLIALLALLDSSAQAQQIHRCTIDGQTVLQQMPCPGAAQPRAEPPIKRTAPQPRPPMGDPAYEAHRTEQMRADLLKWREQAAKEIEQRHQQEQAICPGGSNREPIPGVSKSWVEHCSTWGTANRKTSVTTALGTTEAWQYHRGSLYFGEDGRLRTIISTR